MRISDWSSDVCSSDLVVVLTLNAPKVRNAISLDMRERLLEALRDASASPECRGIVLTGAEANFCAGGQLQQDTAASGPDPQRTRRNIAILHDIVRILSAGPKPTVAAVEGYAYGAGLRSEECRVGTEWVHPCKYRWKP